MFGKLFGRPQVVRPKEPVREAKRKPPQQQQNTGLPWSPTENAPLLFCPSPQDATPASSQWETWSLWLVPSEGGVGGTAVSAGPREGRSGAVRALQEQQAQKVETVIGPPGGTDRTQSVTVFRVLPRTLYWVILTGALQGYPFLKEQKADSEGFGGLPQTTQQTDTQCQFSSRRTLTSSAVFPVSNDNNPDLQHTPQPKANVPVLDT